MDIPRFYPCFPRSFSAEKALFHVCFAAFPQTVLKTGWKLLKTVKFFNTKMQETLSVFASQIHIPLFVAARHPFPSLSPTVTFLPGRGESVPERGKSFLKGGGLMQRTIPYNKSSPSRESWHRAAMTERVGSPVLRCQRSRSRPPPSCRRPERSPWCRGGLRPPRTPPSSSGS